MENIKATKKVSKGKTCTENGRGKMAAKVQKVCHISMRFGTHVWPGNTLRSVLMFVRPQNGRDKIAAKHKVPIATKVVKFLVGKLKSVDLWRTSRPTKKLLGPH